MRIGLDIDGVLCKTFERWVQELRSQGHEVDLEDHEYAKRFGALEGAELFEWYHARRDVLDAEYELYAAAKAVLSLLADDSLVAITNRPAVEGEDEATMRLFERHGLPYRVIHTRDKAAVCQEQGVDILIEDAPHNALSVAESGCRVLLFDKHYNRDVQHENIIRFSHWIEVPRLLRGLGNRNQ